MTIYYDKLNPDEKSVINLIENKDTDRNYFLPRFQSIKWFYPLKEKEYFNPQRVPELIPSKLQNGYYSIPVWDVLPYLEKVSELTKQDGNEKYIDELLEIIKDVTNYEKVDDYKDNYQTWWYFVKILVNLPTEKISNDVLKLIPRWLKSKFSHSIIDTEIITKLLPKFTEEKHPDDRSKMEYLLNILTNYKWEPIPKKRKIPGRSEKDELIPVVDMFWLNDYLVKNGNAKKIGRICSLDLINKLTDKIEDIFKHKWGPRIVEHQHKNTKYRLTFDFNEKHNCIVKFSLHNDNEESKHLDTFISDSPCSNGDLFSDFLQNSIKKLKIDNSHIDSLSSRDFLNIFYELTCDHSYIWIRSIPGRKSEDNIHNPINTYITILVELILGKAYENREDTKSILNDYMRYRYYRALFKRIIIYISGEKWEDYGKYFWDILDLPEGKYIFDGLHYEAEVYTLLEKNVRNFNTDEKDKIEKIIEAGPYLHKPSSDDELAVYQNHWKQNWYSALKADHSFKPRYDQLRETAKIDEIIPSKEPTVVIGEGASPYSKSELLKIPNSELAELMKEFKTENRWRGPSVGGFGRELKSAAQDNPAKFTEDLKPFLDVGYFYIYHMIDGIIAAFKEKKAVNWKAFIQFLISYIKNAEIQDKELVIEDGEWNANRNWVIGQIGWLIQDGTRDDSWAIPNDNMEEAKDLLLLIYPYTEKERGEVKDDPMFYILNSVPGKVLNAILLWALREARLKKYDKDDDTLKWSTEIKNVFEDAYNNEIIDVYILLGEYQANFRYLDRTWIQEKNGDILKKSRHLWELFMHGFLYGCIQANHIFNDMGGHYSKYLKEPITKWNTEELAANHIGIGYLRDRKEFSYADDGYMRLFIKDWDSTRLKELIRLFWLIRDQVNNAPPETKESFKSNIIEFWENLYKHFEEAPPSSKEQWEVISDSVFLIEYLDALDEINIKWLLQIAPYSEAKYNASRFIDYLDRLKDRSSNKIIAAKYLGEIYKEIPTDYLPEYDKGHIQSIVRFIYDSNIKILADDICNRYAERGMYFLRDLYEEYNG